MATPFNEIYPLFLGQVTDYELSVMEETVLEANMLVWLKNAIPFFTTKKDLSIDSTLKQFNADLDDAEKIILSKFMVAVYVGTHLIREENLKSALNSKDYRTYSPANQMKALMELKSHINSEANTLMSRNSWNPNRIKDYFK